MEYTRTKFNKIIEILDNFKKSESYDKDFESNISDYILRKKVVALDIIKGNFTIGTNVKSMIIKWGSLMNKLAKAFHNSDTRKEEEDGDVFKRGELLLEQRNLIVSEFNNFVNSKFPNMKTSHKREKIRFSDLLINERVYNSFDILIAELEANGLSDKEYVKKFEIQSRKFCKNLLVALEVWNSFEASVIFNKEKEDAA